MGPVDESGNEPGKPEIAADKIETLDHAPIIYTPTPRQKFSRAAVLAIAIAVSAALGSAVGAMAAAAFAKPQPLSSDGARTIEVNALRGVITQLSADVASLKASIDNNAKSTSAQMAKIADRVERAEKAQAEPASRVAKLSELLERIDKRTASAAPAPAAAPVATVAAAPAPETTGSVAPKQQDRAPVLNGWVLREVFNGSAMVENERMGMFEVVPGANLPGVGRVENIRRQDGRWVVMTPKGMIVSQAETRPR
jgi:hypothetical protein